MVPYLIYVIRVELHHTTDLLILPVGLAILIIESIVSGPSRPVLA
jgi:hypothetical protein